MISAVQLSLRGEKEVLVFDEQTHTPKTAYWPASLPWLVTT